MCHSTMFAMLGLDALGVGGCGFVEHVVISALQWRVGSVGSRSLPQGIVSGGGGREHSMCGFCAPCAAGAECVINELINHVHNSGLQSMGGVPAPTPRYFPFFLGGLLGKEVR